MSDRIRMEISQARLWELFHQFKRYVVAGVALNILFYLAYLLITAAGVGYKTAATIVFVFGVPMSFTIHRSFTFKSDGHRFRQGAKFGVAYISGYLLNIAGLYVLVDAGPVDHRLAQAIMIVIVALYVFAVQRLWIFATRNGHQAKPGERN